MKKIYNIPEMVVVKVTTNNTILTLSANLSNEEGDRITNSDDFGTKDNKGWSNIWE